MKFEINREELLKLKENNSEAYSFIMSCASSETDYCKTLDIEKLKSECEKGYFAVEDLFTKEQIQKEHDFSKDKDYKKWSSCEQTLRLQRSDVLSAKIKTQLNNAQEPACLMKPKESPAIGWSKKGDTVHIQSATCCSKANKEITGLPFPEKEDAETKRLKDIEYYGFENDFDYAESPDMLWTKEGHVIYYIDSTSIYARLDSKEHKEKEAILIRAFFEFKEKTNKRTFSYIVGELEADKEFEEGTHTPKFESSDMSSDYKHPSFKRDGDKVTVYYKADVEDVPLMEKEIHTTSSYEIAKGLTIGENDIKNIHKENGLYTVEIIRNGLLHKAECEVDQKYWSIGEELDIYKERYS